MKILALKKYFKKTTFLKSVILLLTMFSAGFAFATSSSTDMDLGAIATNITGNFSALTQLITACSYIAGLGFAIGAIMKFKMHKDNPTQVPIGTPISLIFIAAALLFLPSILNVTSWW